jgi:hypothetical protein
MQDRLQEDSSITTMDTDSLGPSFGPLESALYDMTIKYAYWTESKGGALALNIDANGPNGENLRQTLWTNSGTDKGGKNYFFKKDKKTGKNTGEKIYLPGFVIANSIALLAAKKKIGALAVEEKTILLYDYTAKKEVPTKVQMVTELLGKTVTLGIIKNVVDKTAKNDMSGNYEPTGETRFENEIDKAFRTSDGKTVAEIMAKSDTAEFKQRWADKWNDQVNDKSKGTGAVSGSPASAPKTGAAAPVESLFN